MVSVGVYAVDVYVCTGLIRQQELPALSEFAESSTQFLDATLRGVPRGMCKVDRPSAAFTGLCTSHYSSPLVQVVPGHVPPLPAATAAAHQALLRLRPLCAALRPPLLLAERLCWAPKPCEILVRVQGHSRGDNCCESLCEDVLLSVEQTVCVVDYFLV